MLIAALKAGDFRALESGTRLGPEDCCALRSEIRITGIRHIEGSVWVPLLNVNMFS